ARVVGHPAVGVAWLADKVGTLGTPRESGHIVLAGSLTRVVFAKKRDTLHGDFGQLGGIAVQAGSQLARPPHAIAPQVGGVGSGEEKRNAMDMPRNAFKHAIAKGQLQIGLWCSVCSPVAAEIVSHSGYDWLLLDTEHSPNEVPDILAQLQAAQAGTASAIVRP